MKQQDFIELVRNPARVTSESKEALSEFVEKYPYFHAAQVLLTKALHVGNDVTYKDILAKTAISIPDRKRLYEVVIKEELVEEIEQIVDAFETTETPTMEVVQDDAPVDEKPVEEEVAEDKREEVRDELVEQVEEELLSEAKVFSPPKVYDLEALYGDEVEAELPIEQETPEVTPEEIVEDQPEQTGKRSFYDWLQSDANSSVTVSSPSPKQPKKSATSIIDEFIQKRPRISPLKDNITPAGIDKLGVEDKTDLVSETLAKIYIQQKNYQKAIEVYEQLSLSNSEKKGYFASQIHFLRQLVNE